MKKVKLGLILENAARLAGRCVGAMGVPDEWKALGALAMSDGIRRIAGEKFPVMQRVECRQFRPTWTSNTGWSRNMECFYGNRYWRLNADVSSGTPGIASCWTAVDMKDFAAFIEFEQPWENTSIDRSSVDVNRFAYEVDPKFYPDATPLRVVRLSDMGIVIQSPAPVMVFCRFVPRYPNVSFVSWSATSAYEAGDVVYVEATKDCYLAVSDIAAPTGETTNPNPAQDGEHWDVIRISCDFENFLTRYIAADLLTEDQGKYQTRAAAEREFEILCDRFHEGNGESSVRRGRFM